MAARKVTAGRKLKAEFDAALVEASKQLGQVLEWDEHERLALAAAVSSADRREQLQKVYDGELGGEARPGELVRLSGEIRLLDKLVAESLSKVRVGVGVAKSDRHQRAARSRWDREGTG